MKLKKEEIQKIVLGALMAIGVIYAYYEFIMGPLKKRQVAGARDLIALGPKIAEAHSQIKRAENLKAQIPKAEATIAQINSMIPEGSPVAWLPTLISEYFKTKGLEKVTTRMLRSVDDKLAQGYKRISWSVEMPRVDLVPFGHALAELENQEPLIECISLSVEFLREEPERQRVALTLVNTAK